MKKKNTSSKTTKRDIRSFEADKDVAQMLDAAIKAGVIQTKIINEAIRKVGKSVLRQSGEKLIEEADKIERNSGAGTN